MTLRDSSLRKKEEKIIRDEAVKELRNQYISWLVPTNVEVIQDAEFGM